MSENNSELSGKIAMAIESMEVVYRNVAQVFDDPLKGDFGVGEDILHALMVGAFDLRNGLRLCAVIDKGFCADGMDSRESGNSAGLGSEGCGSCGCCCCDCSERGECIGGDSCCKESG